MSVKLEQVAATLGRLRDVFHSGHTLSYEYRLTQLKAIERMFVENQEAIVGAVQKDLGKKHPFEAHCTEYALVLADVRHTMNKLKKWMKPQSVYSPVAIQPVSSYVSKEPLGVCLIMSPWNYPVNLAIVPLIGAIAAGNTALLKLSRHSANVATTLGELCIKYLDSQAVAIEYEGGASMITELIKHKWDHVFFTGSVSVGRIVYEAAAKHLTPVVLELGGKNPVFIDRKVHIPTVARRLAWGKFFNAGQTCVGVDHVYVHKDIEQELIAELKKAVTQFYGENPQTSSSFARIISNHHVKRLAKTFADGEVVIGGQVDEKDAYIAPTVIRNVRADSELLSDEIFGPIMPIIAVDDLIATASEQRHKPSPLATYVFSDDDEVVASIQAKTRSGAFLVNECLIHFTNSNLPFGGVGESGIGKYHGAITFDIFSNARAVVARSTNKILDVPLRYPPYESEKFMDKIKFPIASAFMSGDW
ncbi:aldehyde dehydrogenase [Capsaspora owczarzaki ATCC 30864]|uniref:Aldehyde dehydrogenase n=1 Tax=Capsaspora owczarzaki (strain ATCC 30864) TaxID=595528 RepID=A0A0D2U0Q1_CAPO3|nr:aldehyde dehydrogenase [Capsaspora owczarzaki ATCC 30864]KJE88821.1 aldehyde dehydrogenase [Capsaspora owczarzaki ATCC 30864]|eukprot:XP_004365273.1 aldehyde dehydrogenase [Capsaspora owczarzaki ATCC 30864]